MNRLSLTLAPAGAGLALLAALTTPVLSAAQRERQQGPQLPRYTITDLGTLGGATGRPEGTHSRGWVESAGDDQHAFMGLNGVATDLSPAPALRTLGGPS